MADIMNAAPMVNDEGTQDLSGRVVPSAGLQIPQHLPKFYIFAQKGPLGDRYLDLNSETATRIYGDETFNPNGPYYNHQTRFLAKCIANGNSCVVHRVPGTGAAAQHHANACLYLHVIKDISTGAGLVGNYKRDTNGFISRDFSGVPTQDTTTPTIKGAYVGWSVVTKTTITDPSTINYNTEFPVLTYGSGAGLEPEFIVDANIAAGNFEHKAYPIMAFVASDLGAYSNTIGFRLYSPKKEGSVTVDTTILTHSTTRRYPYAFEMVSITNLNTGSSFTVPNAGGGTLVTGVMVDSPAVLDPTSSAQINLGKVISNNYPNSGIIPVHIFDANIQTAAQDLMTMELAVASYTGRDNFTTPATNYGMLDLIQFTNSNGSDYSAIVPWYDQRCPWGDSFDGTESVTLLKLGKNSVIHLDSGDDGTMNNTVLEDAVVADVQQYALETHEYNDQVLHPESVIYDSGFSLYGKKQLCKFLSLRKDTFIAVGTHIDGVTLTQDQQEAIGTSLMTTIELYPESSTFGTPVMRGIIVSGSGLMIDGSSDKRVSLLYEVCAKASRYMGASNGAWKSGLCFDRAPLSIINELKDLDVSWVPASKRVVLWQKGINFALNYKVRTQFFPALQTVYPDDTSVLNSYFTVVAIAYLNKVAHAAWREFTGSISLTNAQLEERVNNFVLEAVKDKFDGKFVVIPRCTVTEMDALRGYSWTLPIDIYSPNMKTVMTTYVNAYRIDDLEQ